MRFFYAVYRWDTYLAIFLNFGKSLIIMIRHYSFFFVSLIKTRRDCTSIFIDIFLLYPLLRKFEWFVNNAVTSSNSFGGRKIPSKSDDATVITHTKLMTWSICLNNNRCARNCWDSCYIILVIWLSSAKKKIQFICTSELTSLDVFQ